MTEDRGDKRFDLEDRTFAFAKDVRAFVKALVKTIGNVEDARQLIRASGSVGANYIEANEALSKKDFVLRIKICRKEAKESRYFLRLLDTDGSSSSKHSRLDSRGPGVDEHLWRDSQKERVRRCLGNSGFRKLFRNSNFGF